MRNPRGDDRALQRARRRVLPDQVRERLRPVLAVEGLVLRHQISIQKVVAHPRVDRRPPARTTVRGSGQDGYGTPESSPYRCFLPDLTVFGDPDCAGPELSTPFATASSSIPEHSDL